MNREFRQHNGHCVHKYDSDVRERYGDYSNVRERYGDYEARCCHCAKWFGWRENFTLTSLDGHGKFAPQGSDAPTITIIQAGGVEIPCTGDPDE